MKNNEDKNDSEIIFDTPQDSLFTINSHYNSLEINKMIKSSTNIFGNFSPLFTQTMTSFKNGKNNLIFNSKSKKNVFLKNVISNENYENISKHRKSKIFNSFLNYENISKHQKSKIINPFNYKNLKTETNFKKNHLNKQFLLGPENPPTIKDKIRLTSYYKTSEYKKPSYKSPEEKEFKNNLFEKYDIKKNKYNIFPHITDNNLHLKIIKPFFKNSYKANKTIDINRQLVHRINEMTNFFLLKKYFQKIENNQKILYFLKKMPKIQIKSKSKKNTYRKDNEFEDKNHNEKERIKNKKAKNLNNQAQKINYLGSIKFDRFRKFAYNGLIEYQYDEDEDYNLSNIYTKKKVNFNENKNSDNNNENKNSLDKLIKKKFERHYLALNISTLSIAYKPSSRIDFSISKLGNKIYLYGGVSSKIFNEFWIFDIEKNKWNQMQIIQKDDPTARKGHTSIIIKDMLFIYGGEIPKERPYEDLIIYNITINKFLYPKIPIKKKINQRIGHICVGTNQTFLIQGGMDARTLSIENTAFFYNISGNFWQKLECIGQPLPYRIYHCAAMVNYYARSSSGPYGFYFPPDDYQEGSVRKIRHEGIYIFGGINDKKNYTNDLFIIKIGHKPCINIKPKIAGSPPEPRIKGKMLFLDHYYFIIIHGGVKINQNFCSDIVVLNLENYNWIKPIISDENGEGKNLIARIEHQIFFHDDKLYIFGGLGEENILSMNFEIVEFEVTGFYDNYIYPE